MARLINKGYSAELVAGIKKLDRRVRGNSGYLFCRNIWLLEQTRLQCKRGHQFQSITPPFTLSIIYISHSLWMFLPRGSLATNTKEEAGSGDPACNIPSITSLTPWDLLCHPVTGELAVIQVGVEAALGQQLLVGALLDYTALVHNQDQVGVTNGR